MMMQCRLKLMSRLYYVCISFSVCQYILTVCRPRCEDAYSAEGLSVSSSDDLKHFFAEEKVMVPVARLLQLIPRG